MLVRLARTSPEHARVLRYLQSSVKTMSAITMGDRPSIKEFVQEVFPYELLLIGIHFWSLGAELRSAFCR